MKNKVLLFFTLLSFIFNLSFSQCKLEKPKSDFDTTSTISTQKVEFFNNTLGSFITKKVNWAVDIFFISKEKKKYLAIEHSSTGTVSELDYFYIKFDDTTILKFTTPIIYQSYNGFRDWSFQKTEFEISTNDFLKFANKDIDKVQFQFNYFPDSQINERSIKKPKATKIKENAICLKTELKI